MDTAADAITTALSPSATLAVRVCDTRGVSAARRDTSSPVCLLSKNAVSCRTIDSKSCDFNRWPMRCPARVMYNDIF